LSLIASDVVKMVLFFYDSCYFHREEGRRKREEGRRKKGESSPIAAIKIQSA
jgi:hypothetical protein